MKVKFAIGDRVKGTFYGMVKEGTVVACNVPSIVWVRWDTGNKTWVHPQSITKIP